jgi:hypothetical protein
LYNNHTASIKILFSLYNVYSILDKNRICGDWASSLTNNNKISENNEVDNLKTLNSIKQFLGINNLKIRG